MTEKATPSQCEGGPFTDSELVHERTERKLGNAASVDR